MENFIQEKAWAIYNTMTQDEKAVQAFGMTDVNVIKRFQIEFLETHNKPATSEDEKNFVVALFNEAQKAGKLIA